MAYDGLVLPEVCSYCIRRRGGKLVREGANEIGKKGKKRVRERGMNGWVFCIRHVTVLTASGSMVTGSQNKSVDSFHWLSKPRTYICIH